MSADLTLPDIPVISEPDTGPDTGAQFAALDVLGTLAVTAPAAEAGTEVPHWGSQRIGLARVPWPLLAVLAVQAGLSLRLVWSNTAFSDEALYLWAGHLEWANWIHGTPIPVFPAYFSGAAVIYPPLGALADSVGGLAGARLLSLVFMLAATSLMWGTASRLHDRRAGFFGAGLFAMLGPVVKLGAFATYDAMSLGLMALSAWCVVRAGARRDATGWIAAAAAALALANATAYSSAIFDPVVLAIALFLKWPGVTARLLAMRAAALGSYLAAVLILLVTAGSSLYITGVGQTVLSRVAGNDPAISALQDSWMWTGAVVAVAVAGVLMTALIDRGRLGLHIVLASAALLAPIEQARIHTTTSLDKHACFGAWFAAIVAGFAVSAMLRELRPMVVRTAVTGASAAALAMTGVAGLTQARALFTAWPDAASFVAAFRPLADRTTGPMLVETSPVAEYYIPAGKHWLRWSNTFGIIQRDGRGLGAGVGHILGQGEYAHLIDTGYFTLAALNFSASSEHLDQEIAAALGRSGRYRLLETVTYGSRQYVIWEREPQAGDR